MPDSGLSKRNSHSAPDSFPSGLAPFLPLCVLFLGGSAPNSVVLGVLLWEARWHSGPFTEGS